MTADISVDHVDIYYCDVGNTRKEIEKELTKQIEKEINTKLLKSVNSIVNGIDFSDYNSELERRPYKSQKKNYRMHKTPDVSNKPKFVYGKYVPIENIELVGNIIAQRLKNNTRYYKNNPDSNHYGKISNPNNMIGL